MKNIKKDLVKPPKVKRKRQTSARKKANYIDNEDFLNEILLYNKNLKNSKSGEHVSIPDSLAVYFLKIAKNLSSKGNFLNYSFKDDMVSDGVENCIKCVNNSNFDPSKSNNPFSYFTQVIYFAFVRRIKKEKQQMYIKYKSFMESELSENEEVLNMLQKNDSLKDYKREFIANFETSIEKKRVGKRKKNKKQSILDLDACVCIYDDDYIETTENNDCDDYN